MKFSRETLKSKDSIGNVLGGGGRCRGKLCLSSPPLVVMVVGGGCSAPFPKQSCCRYQQEEQNCNLYDEHGQGSSPEAQGFIGNSAKGGAQVVASQLAGDPQGGDDPLPALGVRPGRRHHQVEAGDGGDGDANSLQEETHHCDSQGRVEG